MKKILIVEDDARVASALKIRIEGAGYQTALAEDAISAVSIAVAARPDLVLVDINMPAGNGFSAVEHIRARLPGPLPVVFITASKQPGLVERAGAMGANGFMAVEHPSFRHRWQGRLVGTNGLFHSSTHRRVAVLAKRFHSS